MKSETFSLNSARDGLELRALAVHPEGEARAVVQFSHGMCENKERYVPFMEYLAEGGYACVIHDHRGHGQAALERKELGYFGRDGALSLVDDMHQFTLEIRRRFPGRRIYLFAHSMGSLAARAYLPMYEGELSGVFLSGSPARNPAVGVGAALAKLLSRVQGAKKRNKLLKALSFGPFYRAFPESKCAWLCTNPEVVAAYEADPLCGFTFTNNGFLALFRLMERAYRTRPATSVPDLPIHFLSGEDDPCRSGDRGFEHAVSCMLKRGYQSVTGRVYPGMRHEILNEREKRAVWADVLETLGAWEEKG